MLQIKTIQDARRTRAPLTVAAPSRLHPASVAGSRASPTSGMYARQAGLPGSGRALGGGRGHRHGAGAQWLGRQAVPTTFKCRAVAVQAAPSSPVTATAEEMPSSRDACNAPSESTTSILTEDPAVQANGPRETSAGLRAAAAADEPIRPRLETRQLSDDFELVPADGALEPPKASPHVLPDLEDWELVSPEDADLSI
ncbi:hypothetical protein BMF94_6024 [Rhodotorula taiwanensis]|uniref:Uncharacterized protein n=1 Tax=Rhodotorula taiwanensis TaxID=741276 RepID=A0A2S5B2E9_9BASI|nr:hypothetical protein BMF94_6024 [Rhodotorula taiwanensis]